MCGYLDNMTDTKHHSNNELLAQGLGNIISPFLGGITATAAIARSAVNVKSGAVSPIASIIHALLVLFSLFILCECPVLFATLFYGCIAINGSLAYGECT